MLEYTKGVSVKIGKKRCNDFYKVSWYKMHNGAAFAPQGQKNF